MKPSFIEEISCTHKLDHSAHLILTQEAQTFLVKLHKQFNGRRLELLAERHKRQRDVNLGSSPAFLKETAAIRKDSTWTVAPVPQEIEKRWVEITGPTDRKMMINALNSGADVFMADFEDATSPTWENIIDGQANLMEAVSGSLSYTSAEGKHYRLNQSIAVLMVRPRGWHLEEKHILIEGEPISASLFDFGIAFFHNAKTLLANGSAPYYYLPKLESHQEAKLWNDVFIYAQQELNIPQGTIKATVLIETLWAAFEMEEILYELRHHVAGLNAGRWDYLFSIIKTFQQHQECLLPDRIQITMGAPFMQAYAELLIQTCHKRGAHAMGGMAAFIPSRKDKAVNETAFQKVKEDKLRESKNGFDGTWVAHPDLVPVAREIFEDILKGNPHQKHVVQTSQETLAEELLDFEIPKGTITEVGLRHNISVTLQYLTAWLQGQGAVAIYNLMEDAATAEISRAQLWQWVHHDAKLEDGRPLTEALYQTIAKEEIKRLKNLYKEQGAVLDKLKQADELLHKLVLQKEFTDFLTSAAYHLLP